MSTTPETTAGKIFVEADWKLILSGMKMHPIHYSTLLFSRKISLNQLKTYAVSTVCILFACYLFPESKGRLFG